MNLGNNIVYRIGGFACYKFDLQNNTVIRIWKILRSPVFMNTIDQIQLPICNQFARVKRFSYISNEFR